MASRRIPELNWWLVVLQRSDPTQGGLLTSLLHKLLMALASTLLLLWLANLSIGDYQRRLKLQATTDRLTGRFNRTALDNLFHAVTRAVGRRGESLAALLVDIDHFKAINDSHGHLVGDQAICHVCDCVAKRIRGSDLRFRWGGEEFLLLLPDCDLDSGCRLAEEHCADLRGAPLRIGDGSLPIRISIGLTLWNPGESPHELLARTDRALSEAKARGRDQVSVQ